MKKAQPERGNHEETACHAKVLPRNEARAHRSSNSASCGSPLALPPHAFEAEFQKPADSLGPRDFAAGSPALNCIDRILWHARREKRVWIFSGRRSPAFFSSDHPQLRSYRRQRRPSSRLPFAPYEADRRAGRASSPGEGRFGDLLEREFPETSGQFRLPL
jgi:hypothetical protein